eukprot:Gb_28353 [translate_table: standard]
MPAMVKCHLGALRGRGHGRISTRLYYPFWPLAGAMVITKDALFGQKINRGWLNKVDECLFVMDKCNSYQKSVNSSPFFEGVPFTFLKHYAVHVYNQNNCSFQMQEDIYRRGKLKGYCNISHRSAMLESSEQSRINPGIADRFSDIGKVEGNIETGFFGGEKDGGEQPLKQDESKQFLSATQSPVESIDPAALYQELLRSKPIITRSSQEVQHLADIFMCFAQRGWAGDQALALYINASFFPTAVNKFRTFFTNRCPQKILEYLMRFGPSDETDRFLFPIFAEFCIQEFPDEIARYRMLVQSADLTKPHTWFPFARAMRRKLIYHCGPTNSGKTYSALQKFMEAKSGIYCSPLRLLAMEVFDKVNARGVYCSLHTGQEKKDFPFANHVACTIEMASTDDCYEVAVIDEVQMIGDEFRGFAWSRALLGLKADEIHVCGDPSLLSLVRDICAVTGDDLSEKYYQRFKPLVVEEKTLQGNFKNIQPGDCVVAFSRREIFEVKLAIERYTKHRCCVVYGALPPETRKQQAQLFNNPDSEYDVLVASDAVGMGLNLNIRRVVFYGVKKYNGDKMQPVPASQVKQIAGRAGRRGSSFPEGLTTTFLTEDLQYLIECLRQPFEQIKGAGLFPFFEQMEIFAGQLRNSSFCQLLEEFSKNCRLDGSYFLCRHDHIKKVAYMLDKVTGLSLQDRYNFCFAPVNTRDPRAMATLLKFASSYSKNLPVRIAMVVPTTSAKSDMELMDLETRHQVLSMYLWLSHHFRKETFPNKETAEHMATSIVDILGQSLAKACWKPECRARDTRRIPRRNNAMARSGSVTKMWDQEAVSC